MQDGPLPDRESGFLGSQIRLKIRSVLLLFAVFRAPGKVRLLGRNLSP